MTWGLPNLLTLGRLSLLPVIVWLIWPGIECQHTSFWAAIIYAIAGTLDMVDGHIARTTNQVTVIGKFLDPLADKLVYLVTLIALLQLPGHWVPPWVVMVVLTRELAITGLRAIAAGEGVVIAADSGGKIKTTFGTVGMCGLLIHYPYMISTGFGDTLLRAHNIGLFFTYVSVAFSLVSGFNYVRGFFVGLQRRAVL